MHKIPREFHKFSRFREFPEYSRFPGFSRYVATICNFLLVVHCNYASVLYHFQDLVSYFRKFKEVTLS